MKFWHVELCLSIGILDSISMRADMQDQDCQYEEEGTWLGCHLDREGLLECNTYYMCAKYYPGNVDTWILRGWEAQEGL